MGCIVCKSTATRDQGTAYTVQRNTRRQKSMHQGGHVVMQPMDIIEMAEEISQTHFKGQIDPIKLCCLAILQSMCRSDLTQINEQTGTTGIGLLQLSKGTVQWLRDSGKYGQYNGPYKVHLKDPHVNLYFGAAYLHYLQTTQASSDEKVVRVFCAGVSGAKKQDSYRYWEQYRMVESKLRPVWELVHATCKSAGPDKDSDAGVMHIVRKGQSINRIAKACGVSPDVIMKYNPELHGNQLRAGDCIALPAARTTAQVHVVQCGESLWSIAREYDVSITSVLRHNPELWDHKNVEEGLVIRVPGLVSDSQSSFSSCASTYRHQQQIMFTPYDAKPPPVTLSRTMHGDAKIDTCQYAQTSWQVASDIEQDDAMQQF